MAFVNRCIFFPSSGGTGTWTVSSAVTGYLTPAQAGAANATLYRYTAELRDGSNAVTAWEVGTGTYTVSGTTLSRTPSLSSNANAAVNFATPPQVMLCILAEDLFAPAVSDGAALGSGSLQFSDLFLASGGIIDWSNGAVQLAHGTSTLALLGGIFVLGASVSPPTNGGLLRLNLPGDFEDAGRGIEFLLSSFGNGYGWKIVTPDRGGGATPIAIGYRANSVTWTSRFEIDVTTAKLFSGTFTTNDAAFILKSGTTVTGGGTSNVPTLTSGPVTGNPTKWLPYDDNGVTRYIPSW